MCYIYTITSLNKYDIGNGMERLIYVGSCVDHERRFADHRYDCFNPNSRTYGSKLYKFMREYGFDNFVMEVVEVMDDDTTDIELRQMEQSYIDKFDSKRSMNTYDAFVSDSDKKRKEIIGRRNYYIKNADKMRHKTAETAEQRKKYQDAYRLENADKIRENRNKNRDRYNAYTREWRRNKKRWVYVMKELTKKIDMIV